MKSTAARTAAFASAALWLSYPAVAAHSHHHGHQQFHQHLSHHHSHHHDHDQQPQANNKYSDRESPELRKRGSTTCAFPEDKGLVAVTKDKLNAGWAMAPDKECTAGSYCPIACPPGQVMNQWKAGDETYSFPASTFGGLFCNDEGEVELPFKDQPCCVDGTGTVEVVNKIGDVVSFCQTVLPGFEDMLIPTEVTDTATLAVPDFKYWAHTSAQYYVNPPGVPAADACIWGDSSKSNGNWAPLVAGANTVADGSTFVQLSVNPIWQNCELSHEPPTFGMEIVCPNNDCEGTPCKVGASGITSQEKASGAGGADFCVVTVPPGSKAEIHVYSLDGSGGDSGEAPSSSEPEPTPTPTPTTTTTPEPEPTTTSTTSTPEPTSTPEYTTTSMPPTSSTPSSAPASSTTMAPPTSSDAFMAFGGIFNQQNGTAIPGPSKSRSKSGPSSVPVPTSEGSDGSGADDKGETSSTDDNTNDGSASNRDGSAALGGLVVALIAAGYLL